MSRLLWGVVALLAVILAVVLVPAGPGGQVPEEALAHIITPTGTPGDALVHLEIDADATNGSGPCNPVDATAEVGGMHKVAVCLTSSPRKPYVFDIELLYDDTLNSCPDLTPGGTALDDNPDANAGSTTWGTSLGTNWDCSSGGDNPPVCDQDTASGPAHGKAFITCYTLDVAGPAPENLVIAVVTFNTTAAGVDNLAFGEVWDSDDLDKAIVICPGASCYGATVNVHDWTPTPTPTPTPTATPTPTPTPTPTTTPTPGGAVGGIAELSPLKPDGGAAASDSWSPDTVGPAAVAAGGVLLLAAGAWYARRRRRAD